jgi:voltage-gated potassium channel
MLLPRNRMAGLRRRCYDLLEGGPHGDLGSTLVSRLLAFLVLANLVGVTLESVPELAVRYDRGFKALEWLSLIVFTVEYAMRVWVAVEHAPYRSLPPRRARLNYVLSGMGLVDLISILPFWIVIFVPIDFRAVLVLRVVRYFKLMRYSPGMSSLLDALYAERHALFNCIVILLGTTLFAASLMHLVEGTEQPDKFGTIPDAMWWAIVTLGTVGYGDAVPVTVLGRVVASFTIFAGLIMIALPVGIVATAFADEIHRREFIVTWSMVARVPLFAELNAVEIAGILKLLRAQTFEPGAIIVRRGEPATCMYFIAGGEVEIELPDQKVRLSVGHFFGEMAVLRRSRRSATVRAVSRTSLLALDAHDLHELMEREKRVADAIHEVMKDRAAQERVTPQGDLVAQEIEPGETEEPGGGKKGR